MGNRKLATDTILKYIEKITNSKSNVNMYKDFLSKMSDDEFEQFMADLRDGKKTLQIIVPNDTFDGKITIENNYKIADELGVKFFTKLTIGPNRDIPKYTTSEEFLVIDLPFRRTKQTAERGLSVTGDYTKIDTATGQVAESEAASKLTYPELKVLVGLNMKYTLKEILRDRGGDKTSSIMLNNILVKYGSVNQKTLDAVSTGAISTKTLKTYLLGMHLSNTL